MRLAGGNRPQQRGQYEGRGHRFADRDALVAVEPGTTYNSTNYKWFDDRSDDFIYVDRIVVAPAVKGQGVGRALYERLAAAYVGTARQMTCEVNIDPPNESSMAFHRRMGFGQVGTKLDGSKTVSLMTKGLA